MRTAGGRTGRSGFTLLELLVVMALVGVMLGLGLGVFANLDTGGRVAVGSVQNVLRSAHNWSVARIAPARVLIDPQGQTLRAEGHQVVGTWHFEDDSLTGAFGLDGVKLGGQIVPDGFQGRALSFAGEPPRSRVEMPVQADPSYDFSRGFSIRCAVRLADARGGALLDGGGVVGIETGGDGSLKAWIVAARAEDASAGGRGGRVVLTTEPDLLEPGRWALVLVAYDRVQFRVSVDGQVAAAVAENAPLAALGGPLVLSPGQNAFPGAIDALVVSAVVADEAAELPPSVRIRADAPREVLFQAGGGLDRARHAEPVRVVLEFDDGHTEMVQVTLHGAVE